MDLETVKRHMQGALDALHREFGGLRTGRANPALLEHVRVDAYGSLMPLNQVGTVGAPEPRLLTVQVWDKGLVKAVEKGISDAGLGLNPQADGSLVRVPLPELSQERRQELVRVAGKYAEQARIAVRGVRRDAMDELKRDEKKGDLSEDQHKTLSEKVQTLTDDHVKKVDDALAHKEKDILNV